LLRLCFFVVGQFAAQACDPDFEAAQSLGMFLKLSLDSILPRLKALQVFEYQILDIFGHVVTILAERAAVFNRRAWKLNPI
jgi:hypothetical protein